MLFRVLSYAIGLIGSSTAQITAAMAIISRFQMDNDITYIDVILLMPALNSLSDALSYAGNALGNAAQVYRLLGLYCGIFGGSEATSIARIPRHPAGMAMYLYGASFAWRDGETPVLESVSLDVRYGDVVAVIGRVGSGKSALLAAMSGSLSRCGGVAAVLGDVGLVEPSTWVLDDTFRANIVLDRPFDESKYWQTIENCALGHVVHNWPSGDMEIVNRHMLSASQCSLLSLARAVYADADILLVDDIFSYIDLRTRDRLLAGVLAADPRRAIVAVSRSKPIVSLATKVVRVESGRAIVTKQVPSQWKPGVSLKSDCFDGSLSPIAESILSEGTALDPVEAAAAENISTSRSMRPSLEELIVDAGSHQGLSRALYDYLVSDVVVSIIQQQLVVCESWIRRELWSTKAKVAISQGVMNTVLSSSGAQADWSFRDKALSLLVKGRYVLSSELPQQLNQRAVLALRSGYIAAQVFYTSPVIGLFVVPFVAGYPMLAIVPQYFGFTSGKEQAADTSPRGKAIVTGGKVVVECRNLGLQLHGCTTPLYSNISFALCTGEQLAVIGHNGRGKSVLVRSLFRLANLGPSTATASGSVTINGTDTSTICDSEISDLADFVTSDQVIFDASLRKNLDPLGKFTDAELTRAMRRAGMPEIMPNTTLDTRIMRPSTCQKRMIALCRSLLSKRPIVVFDQLTAGMDALTQKAVHAVVASEFKNRAVVNITNQPSEILSSNYVVAVQ
ncbi:hypothetical protein FBU59_000009 [Linderina macrospora]|uniref:Uncharacterized protein n=1 Tax=Linderina macrospora TaxID=4868 RepID=A0ACC1JIA1_9FUNG|nr:hypothetical protein FBU59_000009 [Linderina macrospora]